MVQYTDGTNHATFNGTQLAGYSGLTPPDTTFVFANWTIVPDTRYLYEGTEAVGSKLIVYNALVTAGYTTVQAAAISGHVLV